MIVGDRFEISFNARETQAIKDMAQSLDISDVQVVRQAVRMYQLVLTYGLEGTARVLRDSPGCGDVE